jgi:CPA1 family monovalent cation:H+ antiporter
LLGITAVFAWFNRVFLHLPNTIGLLIMALLSSALLAGFEMAFPQAAVLREIGFFVRDIDFSRAVPEGMLGYLLFAGALQVNFRNCGIAL